MCASPFGRKVFTVFGEFCKGLMARKGFDHGSSEPAKVVVTLLKEEGGPVPCSEERRRLLNITRLYELLFIPLHIAKALH